MDLSAAFNNDIRARLWNMSLAKGANSNIVYLLAQLHEDLEGSVRYGPGGECTAFIKI